MYQDFIPQDTSALVTNGMQIPVDLQAVTQCLTVGTKVYMFFPQENGRTFMWRDGFYGGVVVESDESDEE